LLKAHDSLLSCLIKDAVVTARKTCRRQTFLKGTDLRTAIAQLQKASRRLSHWFWTWQWL
jgi:hypothetical protein